MPADRFADKVVLVTGGGSGIGAAICRQFGREGARVVVADVNDARAAEVVGEITAAGGTAVASHLDVSSSASVDAAIDAVVATLGRLDVVVNNAGVVDNMGLVTETSDAEWQRVIGVNLTGVFAVSRKAMPLLVQSGGNIVNIASVAGLGGGKAGPAYTASKHGVVGLTRSLAWMHAAEGVRCNAVCPGMVATNIAESSPGFSNDGMARLRSIMKTSQRVAEPAELAEVVAFLASAAASFVNGAIVTADGAWTAG